MPSRDVPAYPDLVFGTIDHVNFIVANNNGRIENIFLFPGNISF
jgi:hypothetical protein